jgi:hypothetical protein
MSRAKLDEAQRLWLTQKLFLFRMELAYDAWADKEYVARLELDGRPPPEEELWRDYQREIDGQWPAYRDYGLRNYSDDELLMFVAAYGEVATERMRYEEAQERRVPESAAYRDGLEDYRLSGESAVPANENRRGRAAGAAELAGSQPMADEVDWPEHPAGNRRIAGFRRRHAPADRGLSPGEFRALAEEIRQEEYAARVRDYGEADAATYEERVRAGADSIRHLEPDPPPVDPHELERLLGDLERGWAARAERIAGPDPNPSDTGDPAGIAGRLAELEARIGDYQQRGAPDGAGARRPWGELGERRKLYEIAFEIDELHLGSDPRAHAILAREVDLDRVPEEERRMLQATAEGRQQRYSVAHSDGTVTAGELTPSLAIEYLASQAERRGGSERGGFGLLAEERRAIAASDAEIAGMTRRVPEGESGSARAWQAASERDRVGLLADLAADHGVDQETFVRRTGRVMGWPDPTAEQRAWMDEAWAQAMDLDRTAAPHDPTPEAASPADLVERAGPPSPRVTGGHHHKPRL